MNGSTRRSRYLGGAALGVSLPRARMNMRFGLAQATSTVDAMGMTLRFRRPDRLHTRCANPVGVNLMGAIHVTQTTRLTEVNDTQRPHSSTQSAADPGQRMRMRVGHRYHWGGVFIRMYEL